MEVREESVGVSLAATDDDDNVVGSCLLPFCALPLLRENSPLCVCVPVAAAIAAAATDSAAGLRRGRWPYSARCHGHQCRVTAIALELRPLTPQGTIATTLVILFDENFDIQLFTNK